MHSRRHPCFMRSGGKRAVSAGTTSSSSSSWEILDDFSARSFRRESQPLLENDAGRALLRAALLAAVQEQLRTGTSTEVVTLSSEEVQQQQQQPPVMFGVCASSGGAARFALDRYTRFVRKACDETVISSSSMSSSSSAFSTALHLGASDAPDPELRLIENVSSLAEFKAPTFIKFAPGLHYYATPLPGEDRGVILQVGDRQCSHLPLGLFGMPGASP